MASHRANSDRCSPRRMRHPRPAGCRSLWPRHRPGRRLCRDRRAPERGRRLCQLPRRSHAFRPRRARAVVCGPEARARFGAPEGRRGDGAGRRQSPVFFTGGDDSIRAIKGTFPTARAGLTLGEDLEGAPLWRYLRARWSELFPAVRLRRCHADFAAVHQRLAGLRVLDYCARVHLPAWVWTVDDEVNIARFIDDPRVAVLITNRPDLALRIRSA